MDLGHMVIAVEAIRAALADAGMEPEVLVPPDDRETRPEIGVSVVVGGKTDLLVLTVDVP